MADLPVTPDDVARAAGIIHGRLHRTPTFSARSIREGLFLKAELFQRTGSFKPRGVLTNLAALGRDERARGVISVSAGNHAQALAWGAAQEGIDALLVMWRDASIGEGGRDPRLRSDGRPRGRRPRCSVRAPRPADHGDGPGVRPPVRRAGHDRRPGNGRARDPRGSRRHRHGRRPLRRRRARRPGSPWPASPPACVSWPSSRRAPRRCATGSRQESPCR